VARMVLSFRVVRSHTSVMIDSSDAQLLAQERVQLAVTKSRISTVRTCRLLPRVTSHASSESQAIKLQVPRRVTTYSKLI